MEHAAGRGHGAPTRRGRRRVAASSGVAWAGADMTDISPRADNQPAQPEGRRRGNISWSLAFPLLAGGIAPRLTPREPEQGTRKLFDKLQSFDADQNGFIDNNEFKTYLQAVGAWHSEPAFTEERWDRSFPVICGMLGVTDSKQGMSLAEFARYHETYRRGQAEADLDKLGTPEEEDSQQLTGKLVTPEEEAALQDLLSPEDGRGKYPDDWAVLAAQKQQDGDYAVRLANSISLAVPDTQKHTPLKCRLKYQARDRRPSSCTANCRSGRSSSSARPTPRRCRVSTTAPSSASRCGAARLPRQTRLAAHPRAMTAEILWTARRFRGGGAAVSASASRAGKPCTNLAENCKLRTCLCRGLSTVSSAGGHAGGGTRGDAADAHGARERAGGDRPRGDGGGHLPPRRGGLLNAWRCGFFPCAPSRVVRGRSRRRRRRANTASRDL
jgi:hypothetical protein